jgi:ADP-ribose pyrophosphatase YjhB (NUDIX family)
MPHFKVGVVGIIQNDLGEYLLFRHTYRTKYPWGLPTGFMEHPEQPEAALRREIEEESGVQVALDRVWRVHNDARRRLISITYRGRVVRDGFVGSPEVSEARFFGFDELPPMLYEQRRLVEDAHLEDTH